MYFCNGEEERESLSLLLPFDIYLSNLTGYSTVRVPLETPFV